MTHHALDIFSTFDLQFILLGLGGVLLVLAALHDVAARTIPNWASLGIALLGVILRASQGQLVGGLTLGLVVFLVATLCWLRGWMGGGDVKMLAAVAIFVPPVHVGDLLVCITLAGGVVGLCYLATKFTMRSLKLPALVRSRPRHLLGRVLRAERWRLLRGASLPYASAICAGTLFVILKS